MGADSGGTVGSMEHEWTCAVETFTTSLVAAGRRPGTIKLRRHYLGMLSREVEAGPWTVTGDDLVGWASAHDWNLETRRSARASCRVFFAWAVATGRREDDPSPALAPVKIGPPTPHPVPEDVLAHALEGVPERVRLMVRLAAEAGLRRGEVAVIHRRDVQRDLMGWSLRVHGKGGRVRVVPLSDGLAGLIRDRAGVGYLFPGNDGGHVSADWVGRLVGRELPEGWSMHSLRHRFATVAYAHDRDLLTVQGLLGHASPATTQRYVRPPGEAARRTVLAVARAA